MVKASDKMKVLWNVNAMIITFISDQFYKNGCRKLHNVSKGLRGVVYEPEVLWKPDRIVCNPEQQSSHCFRH